LADLFAASRLELCGNMVLQWDLKIYMKPGVPAMAYGAIDAYDRFWIHPKEST
jgi:hypothetical protein